MKLKKNKISRYVLGAALALAMLSGSVHAQKVTVTIQNLTHGSHFTPLLVAAHNADTQLYKAGSPASAALQAMAEGGNTSGLKNALDTTGATYDSASGLLAPGKHFTATLDIDGTNYALLSIVGMILPSNDGFIGVSRWKIPGTPGTYTLSGLAYDAGTEANDELLGLDNPGAPGNAGVPAAPGGSAGAGGTGAAGEDTNKTVHIHRGILGDTNPNGGISDLDSRVHRWLNPVAKITVTVSE